MKFVIKNNKKLLYRILIFFLLLTSLYGSGDLEIYFLDVRQGDCTLIITPNKKAVLIDCNSGYHDEPITVLNNLSIQTLEYIIGTHDDGDHVGGLDEFITSWGANKIKTCFDHGGTYDPDWITAANSTLFGRKTINIKTNISIDSNISMFCMAAGGKVYDPTLPPPHISSQLDTSDNGKSVVVILKYKNFDVWIGGDATSPIEDGCINAINNDLTITGDGNITVLRVDHHGSKFHTYTSFLNALNPSLSVISSGGNQYGHPTPEVITRLENVNPINYIYCTEALGTTDGAGIPSTGRGERLGTYGDTELDGDVNLETDGYNVWVNGELKISGGIEYISFTPDYLYNNGIHTTKAEIKINIKKESISNVFLNYSSIGGETNIIIYDNGLDGDIVAQDLIYTLDDITTTKPPGNYNIHATLVLTNGTNIHKTATLEVKDDTASPEATYFTVKYSNQKINMKWKNPSDIDLNEVLIRSYVNSYEYPETPDEGKLVYRLSEIVDKNAAGKEYSIFINDFEYYKRYFYTLFFIDVKNNYSKLNSEILIVPLSEENPVVISDNFIIPDDYYQVVEFIFDETVLTSSISIKIFNLVGSPVKELNRQHLKGNVVSWDLTTNYNIQVGSGIYIASIQTSKGEIKKKILIVR